MEEIFSYPSPSVSSQHTYTCTIAVKDYIVIMTKIVFMTLKHAHPFTLHKVDTASKSSNISLPYGLKTGLSVPLMTKGPFSKSRASSDEQPGPPVSHTTRGSLEGSLRLSKNQ